MLPAPDSFDWAEEDAIAIGDRLIALQLSTVVIAADQAVDIQPGASMFGTSSAPR